MIFFNYVLKIWNDTLAEEAQKITDDCNPEYGTQLTSKPLTVPAFKFDYAVGQLTAQLTEDELIIGSNFNSIIQLWFDEYKKINYPERGNGYFTQVIS